MAKYLKNIPRVSEILDMLCPLERGATSDEQLSIKARFGTDVHRLCKRVAIEREYRVRGSGSLADYAKAFQQFLKDVEAQVVWSERHMVFNGLFQGTPDLLLKYDDIPWLIDIKTGVYQRRHGAQLAAYRHMAEGDGWFPIPRCSVLSLAGGRYKVHDVPFEELRDGLKAFLGVAEGWNWRKRYLEVR